MATTIFTVAGVVWIVGTAGASDNNTIAFYEIITRAFQGFSLCGVAWVLNFIKNALQ